MCVAHARLLDAARVWMLRLVLTNEKMCFHLHTKIYRFATTVSPQWNANFALGVMALPQKNWRAWKSKFFKNQTNTTFQLPKLDNYKQKKQRTCKGAVSATYLVFRWRWPSYFVICAMCETMAGQLWFGTRFLAKCGKDYFVCSSQAHFFFERFWAQSRYKTGREKYVQLIYYTVCNMYIHLHVLNKSCLWPTCWYLVACPKTQMARSSKDNAKKKWSRCRWLTCGYVQCLEQKIWLPRLIKHCNGLYAFASIFKFVKWLSFYSRQEGSTYSMILVQILIQCLCLNSLWQAHFDWWILCKGAVMTQLFCYLCHVWNHGRAALIRNPFLGKVWQGLFCLFQPSAFFFERFWAQSRYKTGREKYVQLIIHVYTSTCFKQILFVAYLLVSRWSSKDNAKKKWSRCRWLTCGYVQCLEQKIWLPRLIKHCNGLYAFASIFKFVKWLSFYSRQEGSTYSMILVQILIQCLCLNSLWQAHFDWWILL